MLSLWVRASLVGFNHSIMGPVVMLLNGAISRSRGADGHVKPLNCTSNPCCLVPANVSTPEGVCPPLP